MMNWRTNRRLSSSTISSRNMGELRRQIRSSRDRILVRPRHARPTEERGVVGEVVVVPRPLLLRGTSRLQLLLHQHVTLRDRHPPAGTFPLPLHLPQLEAPPLPLPLQLAVKEAGGLPHHLLQEVLRAELPRPLHPPTPAVTSSPVSVKECSSNRLVFL